MTTPNIVAAAIIALFYAIGHWKLVSDWGRIPDNAQLSHAVLMLIFDIALVGGIAYELAK